jgi:truncated hemoglobin YjbI
METSLHCAAAAWHSKHLAHLRATGLSPDLFERYISLFERTMQHLNLPLDRIATAERCIRAQW